MEEDAACIDDPKIALNDGDASYVNSTRKEAKLNINPADKTSLISLDKAFNDLGSSILVTNNQWATSFKFNINGEANR